MEEGKDRDRGAGGGGVVQAGEEEEGDEVVHDFYALRKSAAQGASAHL